MENSMATVGSFTVSKSIDTTVDTELIKILLALFWFLWHYGLSQMLSQVECLAAINLKNQPQTCLQKAWTCLKLWRTVPKHLGKKHQDTTQVNFSALLGRLKTPRLWHLHLDGWQGHRTFWVYHGFPNRHLGSSHFIAPSFEGVNCPRPHLVQPCKSANVSCFDLQNSQRSLRQKGDVKRHCLSQEDIRKPIGSSKLRYPESLGRRQPPLSLCRYFWTATIWWPQKKTMLSGRKKHPLQAQSVQTHKSPAVPLRNSPFRRTWYQPENSSKLKQFHPLQKTFEALKNTQSHRKSIFRRYLHHSTKSFKEISDPKTKKRGLPPRSPPDPPSLLQRPNVQCTGASGNRDLYKPFKHKKATTKNQREGYSQDRQINR